MSLSLIMKRPPTDREILKKIHDRYYSDFCNYDEDNKKRSSKIYVPIDCDAIAKELKTDSDIIFGRLYYHLDKKYGYEQDDGSKIPLFSMRVGGDKHVVNFPLLSAVLAELELSHFKFLMPLVLSIIALGMSIWNFIIATL